MQKHTINVLLLIFIILGFNSPLPAQPAETSQNEMSFDLKETIPLDPDVIKGRLDNGVIYYIMTNKKPEERAELRLVINAGSILETEAQQGLAHFVEHMAFNGSENFEKQELVDYLESIGMRFGPDLNAYTGFDETVYMLQVPTDSTELVETAFQILEDWAHLLSLEEEEIDKERGVIVEEWRLGRGAEARMMDEQFPILFKGSKYADRLPIGKVEIVENFEYETLRDFYRDWYRPDNMSVVAVGDFDPAWVEELIKQHFTGIPMPKDPPVREEFEVPDHEETLFAISSDPEATMSRIAVYYKHLLEEIETIADYREKILADLYNGMLNQRLVELTKEADPPFIFGFSAQGRFLRTKNIYFLMAMVPEGGIERGLEAILTEAKRVKQYGFTETELERQKKETLRAMEQQYNESDKTESSRFASQFVSNFLNDTKAPGIEWEYELYKQVVPDIKLEEINALADKWIRDESRVIMANSPEKDGLEIPTEEDLLAVFNKVEDAEITAYSDDVSDAPLVETPPEGSEVISEEYIEDIDTYQWTLGNGVEVILKPTDFKNDQVLFTAFSPGGHSLASDEDYIAASTAASLINEGGLAHFTEIELEKKLAGKVVNVSPWIGSEEEGLSGNASPEDLETMFQLIYLYFTEPRADTTAFQAYKKRMESVFENRSSDPESVFGDTISWAMTQYHPRMKPWSVERLEEMDLQKSFEIYNDRFADAGDFTFVLVGNLEPEEIKPMVEAWLGGLPSIDRTESWRDLGIDPPDGLIEKEVRKGLEPKSYVRIIFPGDFEWSRQNRYDLMSTAALLRIKLREVLREDMGGTYGVGVYAGTSKYPEEEYAFTITFGCNPERVDEMTETVFLQLDSLKQYGPDESYVQKVREMQRREREKDLKENRFWLSSLQQAYSHDIDPRLIMQLEELTSGLGPEDIQQTAKKYLDMSHYALFVLYPEKEKQVQEEQ
jgi:zinc protease